jgi:chlorobactene glucosyltransferase
MAEEILFWCLGFSLGYLLLTSLILVRNRFELTSLPAGIGNRETEPKISVCIPARNEEKTLPVLLESLASQSYSSFSVYVLDDHSEDNTPMVLNSFQETHPGLLQVLQGEEKPKDWLGKPWACHQLGLAADGDILLFLDADTRLLNPGTLAAVASAFEQNKTDMITVWPQQELLTFWEKTLIPLIYYGLVTILPAIYVYRKPRWMPSFIYSRFSTSFAAANGQCIAFRRESYQTIGGHEPVKDRIVEDVELAKTAKQKGLTLRMFHGVGFIACRMYESGREIFSGLRKNFLAGFSNSIPLFIAAALVHIAVFLVPFAAIVISLFVSMPAVFYLSAACITLILVHRLFIAAWFRWDPLYAFTHPLGVLFFQWLGLVKLADHFTGRKTEWKGRKV